MLIFEIEPAIHIVELLESRLSQQEVGDSKKSTKKMGENYKTPKNFKSFEETIPV